jgi:hypothetical protein
MFECVQARIIIVTEDKYDVETIEDLRAKGDVMAEDN